MYLGEWLGDAGLQLPPVLVPLRILILQRGDEALKGQRGRVRVQKVLQRCPPFGLARQEPLVNTTRAKSGGLDPIRPATPKRLP